jgi:hypothetical protein
MMGRPKSSKVFLAQSFVKISAQCGSKSSIAGSSIHIERGHHLFSGFLLLVQIAAVSSKGQTAAGKSKQHS